MYDLIGRLWVPGPLPGMNEILALRGQAHGRGDRWNPVKRQWEHTIGLLANVQKLQPFGPAYWTYLLLEPHKRRDPLNVFSGAAKVIEDALGPRGMRLVENDGWKHVLGIRPFWDTSATPGVFLVLSHDRCLDSVEIAAEYSYCPHTPKVAA